MLRRKSTSISAPTESVAGLQWLANLVDDLIFHHLCEAQKNFECWNVHLTDEHNGPSFCWSKSQIPSEARSQFSGWWDLVPGLYRICHHCRFPQETCKKRRIVRVGWGAGAVILEIDKSGLQVHLAVLAYFDKDAHTRVISDDSRVGLGGMLVQETNGEIRTLCYASRSYLESSGATL